MLSNKDYWIKRYQEMKGFNVVGHRSWTYEEYIKETQKFFKHIDKHIPTEFKKDKDNKEDRFVLDFGCGIGRCIPFLSQYFGNYIGVDIVDEVIIRNRKRFRKIEDDCKLEFYTIRHDGVIPVKRKFDLIFSNVVLQHVVDDGLLRFYVHQFRTLIKNNGKVLLIENIDQKPKKHQGVKKYIKFRSFNQYKDLFEPYFKLKLVDKFVSSKEEHGVMIGEL